MTLFFRLFILLLMSTSLQAQTNLVVNGDFEEYSTCPDDFVRNGKTNTSISWTSPNNSTPDYFNKCSKLAGVPENFSGVRQAFSGAAYGGIVAAVHSNTYKEYLQAPLTEPLEKGKKYKVVLHVCWAHYSTYMISNLGVKFNDTLLNVSRGKSFYNEDLSFPIHNYNDWETVVDTFTAKGTEKYIVIGNFQPYDQLRFIKKPATNWVSDGPLTNASYYLIDQVMVTEYQEPSGFPVGQYFVGEGIYFELDKYELSDSSSVYLNRVTDFMKAHPEMKVRIEGHTDRYGAPAYNYTLSEKRAEEVKKYLITHGITEDRITTYGWGYDQPVTEQEDLQYLNRRIELLFQ